MLGKTTSGGETERSLLPFLIRAVGSRKETKERKPEDRSRERSTAKSEEAQGKSGGKKDINSNFEKGGPR